MKKFNDLLVRVLKEGELFPDRTGVGRIKIFGVTERFDLKSGFPLVNTRYVPYKSMIRELKWFIQGRNDLAGLRPEGNDTAKTIWDQWSPTEESVKSFVDRNIKPIYEQSIDNETALNEELSKVQSDLSKKFVGKIGRLYGSAWRNVPLGYPYTAMQLAIIPKVSLEDIPSDKLAIYKADYEEIKQEILSTIRESFHGQTDEQLDTVRQSFFKEYVHSRYNQTIDQLGIVMHSLKHKPFSSRHVISNWIPEFIPFETLSPEDNVILGKGSLAACHCTVQFLVRERNNVKYLSCLMFQRSCDLPVGVPFNISQYSLLTYLIAHVLGYVADEFVWVGGDVHIYQNQVELVKEQIERIAYPPPQITINPNLVDLFQFHENDVTINNYEYHPAINYPVAK